MGPIYQKRQRDRRRAEGKCTICGHPATPDYRTCADCRERSRAHHARYRAAGLCGTCGRRPPQHGYAQCWPCNVAAYERYHGKPDLTGISSKINPDLDPRTG